MGVLTSEADTVLYAFYRAKAYDANVSPEMRAFARLWLMSGPKFRRILKGAAIRIRDDHISPHGG